MATLDPRVSEKFAEIRSQLEINVSIAKRDHPEGPIVDGKRIPGLCHSQEILASHIEDRLKELEALLSTAPSGQAPLEGVKEAQHAFNLELLANVVEAERWPAIIAPVAAQQLREAAKALHPLLPASAEPVAASHVAKAVDRHLTANGLKSLVTASPPASGAVEAETEGLSEWAGWDRSRGDWSASKHKDAVLAALFDGAWSIEDAAALIGFIDRTWTKRPAAPTEGR